MTGSIPASADLSVDNVIVSNGATLGGTGSVPLTILSSGAILAPGLPTALGTLTVSDALEFCSCTFYDVKVTSTGNDLTNAVNIRGSRDIAFVGNHFHDGPDSCTVRSLT